MYPARTLIWFRDETRHTEVMQVHCRLCLTDEPAHTHHNDNITPVKQLQVDGFSWQTVERYASQGPHYTTIMKPLLKLPPNMAADSLR